MKYNNFIKEFSKVSGVDFESSAEFINTFFETIKIGLAKNEKIVISKFGTFTPKIYKSKLKKNKETGEFEPVPETILPHYKPSKATLHNKKTQSAPKKLKVLEIKESEENSSQNKNQNFNLNKLIIVFLLFLIINLSLSLFIGIKIIKSKYLANYISNIIEQKLYEKGLSYESINELVNTKFQEAITKTEEYSYQLQTNLTSRLQILKESQEASLAKLKEIENSLKLKIEKMIKPLSKKRDKKTEVKILLYEIKKNDTLWALSKKFMNNPYNWVGLYYSNGEKIKDPNKIYPGMKIFIPIIIENDDSKRENPESNKK